MSSELVGPDGVQARSGRLHQGFPKWKCNQCTETLSGLEDYHIWLKLLNKGQIQSNTYQSKIATVVPGLKHFKPQTT